MMIDNYKHSVLCRKDKASVLLMCSKTQTKTASSLWKSEKQQHSQSNQFVHAHAIRHKDIHASSALTIITL